MTKRRTSHLRAAQPPRFPRCHRGATLAALAGREPALVRAANQPKATADSVIVLWMAGGMAQTETFDPKKYTPFASGVPINQVLMAGVLAQFTNTDPLHVLHRSTEVGEPTDDITAPIPSIRPRQPPYGHLSTRSQIF